MQFKTPQWRKLGTTLALGAVLGSSLFTTGFNYLGNDITLKYNNTTTTLTTYSETVGDVLKSRGITLAKGAVVRPGLSEKVNEDMIIKVLQPVTRVLMVNGVKKVVTVPGETSGEILKEAGISLKPGDTVTPDKNTPVKEGQVITVTTTTALKNREIPFEREVRKDPSLFQGEKKTIQQGQNGIIQEKLEKSGKTWVVVGSTVVKEPVKEIIAEGTKVKENTIHGKKYVKKIVMQGTAYDPSAGSLTAMGTRARVGAVAVDPRVIPLGTKLYIESMDGFPTYGFAVAEDTGGAIKGKRIDLFYNTNREANRFGRRNVMVYVLED